MQDSGYMMASHTAQLMTEKTFVSIIGRYQEVLQAEYGRSTIPVKPSDISPFLDLEEIDGSAPGTENLEAMNNFMMIALKDPMLAQQFDTVKIFSAVARAAGFKNVHEFIKQPVATRTAQPDEIERGVQAGNLVSPEELNAVGGVA